MDTTQTGQALPPWSLSAAGPDSAPAPAHAKPPGDTDFGTDEGYMFGEDGFTFADALDIINPLQHIPVVSTLYRAVTGDEIAPGARMMGGALFGGPTGFAAAVFNNAMVDHTGKDVGETVLAAMLPEETPEPVEPTIALAGGDDADVAPGTPDTGAPPPAALTAPGADGPLPQPLLPATGASPVLTAELPRPLYETEKRSQAPAAPPAAPLRSRDTVDTPPAVTPAQVTATETAPARAPDPAAAPAAKPERKAAPAKSQPSASFQPTPLDPSLIPQAMLSALEKYEQMKRGS